MSAVEIDDEMEGVEEFRQRARSWIRANLHRADITSFVHLDMTDEEELARITHHRELQRMLFDAGLAGICFPRAYGGQGLTPAHQAVLDEELRGYEYPAMLQVPTMAPCAAVILECGTEEQKRAHIPAILKGDEIWMQFLSEPSGGSDVAGALTTAMRDGDEWILNGSKIWTTGAWWSDWALCLARTNWEVPKHRGLTVFMVPIDAPGVEVHRIEMLNGNKEFCQEFMTDVRVPDTDRIGEVDDGWTVGTRWMSHERLATAHNSPFIMHPMEGGFGVADSQTHVAVAREVGRIDDPRVRDLVGEGRMLELVTSALQRRIGEGVTTGRMPEQAGSISRLFGGVKTMRMTTIAFEIAGAAAGAWTDDDRTTADRGNEFLIRQVAAIGGGTLEMARNVVSERVLGMPREQTLDRNVAFRDVPRG